LPKLNLRAFATFSGILETVSTEDGRFFPSESSARQFKLLSLRLPTVAQRGTVEILPWIHSQAPGCLRTSYLKRPVTPRHSSMVRRPLQRSCCNIRKRMRNG